MRTKIIYEDNDILVIHKPAGIAVQTAQVGRQDVVSELKNYLTKGQKNIQKSSAKGAYLGVIHRLDQPVEGLLVFAKTPKAAADLSAQLQKDDFSKEYLAVVCGKPATESGELVDYLVKEGSVARVVEGEAAVKNPQAATGKENVPTPKRAALKYSLRDIKEIAGGLASLLEIKLETGRFHQIRVQLSHAGHPILGDNKYGSEYSQQLSRQGSVRNTALCAYKLRFRHPAQKKTVEYTVAPTGEAFANFQI